MAEAAWLGERLAVLDRLCVALPLVEPLALHLKERVEVGVEALERLAPGAAAPPMMLGVGLEVKEAVEERDSLRTVPVGVARCEAV